MLLFGMWRRLDRWFREVIVFIVKADDFIFYHWSSNVFCVVCKFLPQYTASHLRKQLSSKANMSAHIRGTEANKTSYSHRADFGLYKNLNKNTYYSRVARHRYFGLHVRWRQPCFPFRSSCRSSVCMIDGREVISVRVSSPSVERNLQNCRWVYCRETACCGRSRC
jgi:hypothetical protein